MPRNSASPEFDAIINTGTVKYAVNQQGEQGELLVMQKFAADGTEISHAILTGGKPVVTAGEAQIAGNAKAGYWGIDIDNNSGHFLNDATIEQNECLRDIAKNAFMGFGIHF